MIPAGPDPTTQASYSFKGAEAIVEYIKCSGPQTCGDGLKCDLKALPRHIKPRENLEAMDGRDDALR